MSELSSVLALRALTRVALAVTFALSLGCERNEGPPAYRLQPAEATRPLVMDSLKSIYLGNAVSNSASEIEDAVLTSNRVYVIDGAAHQIRGYDRDGASVFNVPYGPKEAIRAPVGIDVVHGTVGLLELSRTEGIIELNANGISQGGTVFRLESSAIDVSSIGNQFAVATIQTEEGLAKGSGSIVSIVSSMGATVAEGCAPNPLYQASVRKHGLLQLFRKMGVTTRNGVIYCRQPVSPVVQMLSSTGVLLGAVNLAPPFYRAPGDMPLSMSQRQLERFRGTWTEHVQFYPTATGFVSIYLSYDTKVGRNEYDVFACDSASGALQCQGGRAPGRPVFLLGSDTLVVSSRTFTERGVGSLVMYQLR